ncbi:MAG: DUF3575 domain-containing protein, partial [Bacteroidetes bacterium]
QAYPTGLIPGAHAEYLFQQHHCLQTRAGYNLVRHRDLGVQDDERGDGWGGTLGYRYYFREGWSGWFLGARNDIWRNRIDWLDKDDNGTTIDNGTSKIIVVQPTAEAGYRFLLGDSGWFISPSAAYGIEINVQTNGKDVGEGTIMLIGISAGKRF